MKIYFNSSFVERERITDDLWVKDNNGNTLYAYFDNLDLANANVKTRLVIEWANGETTNELVMNKSIGNGYVYITLPRLAYSGKAKFTLRIYRNEKLEQTCMFTRNIKENVDASDDVFINNEEYEAILNAIENLNTTTLDKESASKIYQVILKSGINIKTINGMSLLGSGDIEIKTSTGDVVNITSLNGTNWQLKDDLDLSFFDSQNKMNINFNSNGKSFGSITLENGQLKYGNTVVYVESESGEVPEIPTPGVPETKLETLLNTSWKLKDNANVDELLYNNISNIYLTVRYETSVVKQDIVLYTKQHLFGEALQGLSFGDDNNGGTVAIMYDLDNNKYTTLFKGIFSIVDGGEDLTDSTIINWFETNCEQVEFVNYDFEEKTTNSLDGLTFIFKDKIDISKDFAFYFNLDINQTDSNGTPIIYKGLFSKPFGSGGKNRYLTLNPYGVNIYLETSSGLTNWTSSLPRTFTVQGNVSLDAESWILENCESDSINVEEKVKVTIHYGNALDNLTEVKYVAKGGTITLTPKTVNGYTFEGWFSDSSFNDVFDFSEPINENVDVYAKYVVISNEEEGGDDEIITPSNNTVVFNGTLNNEDASLIYSFTCNNKKYSGLIFSNQKLIYVTIAGSQVVVYNNSWLKEYYRIIVFDNIDELTTNELNLISENSNESLNDDGTLIYNKVYVNTINCSISTIETGQVLTSNYIPVLKNGNLAVTFINNDNYSFDNNDNAFEISGTTNYLIDRYTVILNNVNASATIKAEAILTDEKDYNGRTYVILEKPTYTSGLTTELTFTSNETIYESVSFRTDGIYYDDTKVYDGTNWVDINYRLITIDSSVSGTFADWIEENKMCLNSYKWYINSLYNVDLSQYSIPAINNVIFHIQNFDDFYTKMVFNFDIETQKLKSIDYVNDNNEYLNVVSANALGNVNWNKHYFRTLNFEYNGEQESYDKYREYLPLLKFLLFNAKAKNFNELTDLYGTIWKIKADLNTSSTTNISIPFIFGCPNHTVFYGIKVTGTKVATRTIAYYVDDNIVQVNNSIYDPLTKWSDDLFRTININPNDFGAVKYNDNLHDATLISWLTTNAELVKGDGAVVKMMMRSMMMRNATYNVSNGNSYVWVNPEYKFIYIEQNGGADASVINVVDWFKANAEFLSKENVTYSLKLENNKLMLVGSDGSISKVTLTSNENNNENNNEVDLSNHYTKKESDNKFVSKTSFDTTISGINTSLNGIPNTYATKSAVETLEADLNQKINSNTTSFGNYYTKTALNNLKRTRELFRGNASSGVLTFDRTKEWGMLIFDCLVSGEEEGYGNFQLVAPVYDYADENYTAKEIVRAFEGGTFPMCSIKLSPNDDNNSKTDFVATNCKVKAIYYVA